MVQEALIGLYRRLGNVRDPLAIAGWIFRVVTCMLPVLGLMAGAEELTERHEAEYFAQVPKHELRIDVARALESLPDMYREVILLRDMEQLTITEAADRLRITTRKQSQKSSIHRGRALIRGTYCKAMSREVEEMNNFFQKHHTGLFATQTLTGELMHRSTGVCPALPCNRAAAFCTLSHLVSQGGLCWRWRLCAASTVCWTIGLAETIRQRYRD